MQIDLSFYELIPVDPEIEYIPGESLEQLFKENCFIPLPPLKRSSSEIEREETQPKRVKWSPLNEARILREVSQSFTDVKTTEDTLMLFLKNQNAYDSSKRRHHNSTYWKSEDPEEVKEIVDCFDQSVKKMTDKKLKKNYLRLMGKQQHIFSKQRDADFQSVVTKYILKYQRELFRRNLLIQP